jgi:hypothetical protein
MADEVVTLPFIISEELRNTETVIEYLREFADGVEDDAAVLRSVMKAAVIALERLQAQG